MTSSPKKTRKTVERCSWHKPDNFTSYDYAHAEARDRISRGEKQRLCAKCRLWYWPHELGNEPETKTVEQHEGTA